MTRPVTILGAGLAGLSAAVELVREGAKVRIFEASPHAGGRCRAYFDKHLGLTIDNGNHLVLSGNSWVQQYCETIGADGWHCFDETAFPFYDCETKEHWSIRMNDGSVPYWIFRASERAAGTSWRDYWPAVRLLRAKPHQVVTDFLDTSSPAYARFWEPLTLAIVNTAPENAAAVLLKEVFQETVMAGGKACRPMIARENLGQALIEPALTYLEERSVTTQFGQRVQAIAADDVQITSLRVGKETLDIGQGEHVIMALPSWEAGQLLPALDPPGAGEGILNIHYAYPTQLDTPRFLGMVSSLAQWVFLRGDCVSVTVSAAGKAMAEKSDVLAKQCWAEVAAACNLDDAALPLYRVIKEKRATFDQSPQGIAKRRPAASHLNNLSLAGDWTDHKIPSTIECAIRSGQIAARLALAKNRVQNAA